MPSDLPGRPGWRDLRGVWNRFGMASQPQLAWQQGVSALGLTAMESGGWTSVGGGWPAAPRKIGLQSGVLATTIWALPRMALYSDTLNRTANAYGAAVGQVPTRQLVFEPPRMPAGLNRRDAERWRSQYGFQLPIAVDAPAVGINNPVLPGSREDPAGPKRPVGLWR